MIKDWTAKVVTNPFLNFESRQLPTRLDDGALSMHPVRLNGVQPGAFDRQKTGKDAYSSRPLGHEVVLPDPLLNHGDDVPGSIVPYQKKRLFAFLIQLLASPFQKGYGGLADGTARHKAQAHLRGVGAQQAVASQRYWVRVFFVPTMLHQAQRSFAISPAMERRL